MVGDRSALIAATAAYVGLARTFSGPPGRLERRLFTTLNEGADWRWLRGPQQLGTPWALPAAAGVLALRGRRVDACAALLALPVEKGLEVGTKQLMQRPRPITEVPTALRDDAPVEGPAFPSGHAAIAAATTTLLAPAVPRRLAWALAGCAFVASHVRVHQGAHWPSDAAGGLCLGVAVATGLRLLTRQVAAAASLDGHFGPS